MTTHSTINIGNDIAGSAALPGGVNSTYFYARFVGYIIPSVTGVHTIGVNSQDGCSLYIGGQSIVENLTASQSANGTLVYKQSGTINLTAGVFYPVVLEWQHGSGSNYECQLAWTVPGGSIALIPTGNLSDSAASITGVLDGTWWNGTSGLWYPTGPGIIDFASTVQVLNSQLLRSGNPPVTVPIVVSNSLTTGGAIGQWTAANAVTIPGVIEFDVLATAGGIMDVLLFSSTGSPGPNGYILRFDARSTKNAGQILTITNGTWANIGTAQTAANTTTLTGWHHVLARYSVGGVFDIFVDGVWQYTATDTTFAPTGATYYGYEVLGNPTIAPTGFTQKTLDQMVDGTTYAKVCGTALTSGSVDLSKAGVLAKGSIPPTINDGFGYSCNTNSITWAWPATPLLRADGTVTTIPSGTQAITGLNTNTPYFFYIVYNETTGVLKFLGTADLTQSIPNVVSVALTTSGELTTATSFALPTAGFTLECWYQCASGSNGGLMSKNTAQTGTISNYQASLYAASGLISGSFSDSGATLRTISSTQRYDDGALHHIVYVVGSTTHYLYVDGVQVATATLTLGPTTSTGYIRLGKSSTNVFLAGNLTHCAYYNTLLNATQIQNHANLLTTLGATAYEAVVIADGATYAWWLTDTSGTTAADEVASNTATYTGTHTLNQSLATLAAAGSPAIAWAQPNMLVLQAQNLQGVDPLSVGGLLGSTTASGSGGGGGGGGNGCPAMEMFVDAKHQVSDLSQGMSLNCLEGNATEYLTQPITTTIRPIQWMKHSNELCYQLVAENGAEVIISGSTPVPTRERIAGEVTEGFASQVHAGLHVITDVGNGIEWSRLSETSCVGVRPVARLFCGGSNFAAGVQAGKYIYTHNTPLPPGGGSGGK